MPRTLEHDLLADRLNGGREIHFTFRDGRLGIARRPAKQTMKLLARHRHALAIIEVRHVHPKRTVVLDMDEIVENQMLEAGFTVRRQSHDLVLTGIDTKARVVSKGAVKQSERVWKTDLVCEAHTIAFAVAERCRCPL